MKEPLSKAESFAKKVLYEMQDAALECQDKIDSLSKNHDENRLTIMKYRRRIIDIYDDVFSVRYLGSQYQAGNLSDEQLYRKISNNYGLFKKARVGGPSHNIYNS